MYRSLRCCRVPTLHCTTRPFSSTSSNMKQYDIAIIGAGMVGSTLAVALANNSLTKHLKIAILDTTTLYSNSTTLKEIPNIRVSSITPYNAQQYTKYGVWQNLQRYNQFTRMYVNECYSNNTHIEWTAEQCNSDVLGYIVENNLLQSALITTIHDMQQRNTCNIDIYDTINITKIGHSYKQIIPNTYPVIKLSNDTLTSCKLLVGADGPQSMVKKFANISSTGYDYNQRAVVATVKLQDSHHTAYQRFLPTGPVACLPCHDQYSNIVWSTTPQHAQYLTTCSNEQFLHDLNAAYNAPSGDAWRSGGQSPLFNLIPTQLAELAPILFATPNDSTPPTAIEVCDKRASFPLKFVHSLNYVDNRLALIGDAAHVIHPLAGQGVNLGITDAFVLSDTIANGVSAGQDIGAIQLLQQYERQQQRSNLSMMTGIDLIGRIFQLSNGGLPTLRNAGINIFNSIPGIKNRIASIAMGLTDTPTTSTAEKQHIQLD